MLITLTQWNIVARTRETGKPEIDDDARISTIICGKKIRGFRSIPSFKTFQLLNVHNLYLKADDEAEGNWSSVDLSYIGDVNEYVISSYDLIISS